MLKGIFKTKFLLYLLLLNLISIFFVYSQKDVLQYVSTYSNKYTNINFDSASKDESLSKYKEFKENNKPSGLKDIEVSFDATVYSISQYDNIFQTAPVNSGLRIELSKIRTLGLVIGYKNNSKLIGYPMISKVDFNKKYNIRLYLDKTNKLQGYVNNKRVINIQNQNLSYEISDIAVGTGFSKSRSFNGKIENFSINYNYYQKDPQVVPNILLFLSITFFLILFTLIIKFDIRAIKFFDSRLYLKRSIKSTKIEFYPFLFAAFPMLFLLSNNLSKVGLFDFVQPLIISLVAASFLYLILNFFFDYKKTALIVSLFLTYFYSGGHIYNLVRSNLDPEIFIYILSIIFLTLLFLLTTKNAKAVKLTSSFFRSVSITIVVLSLINIGFRISNIRPYTIKNNQLIIKSELQEKGDEKQIVDNNKPDIYYIILDMYANNWTLKSFFDYDNAPFLDHLSSKGFFIADEGTSNYRTTSLSIPSALNMQYYSKDINLSKYQEENKVVMFLKDNGYKFVRINPDGAIISYNKNADVNADCNKWKEFSTILLQTTVLFNMDFLLSDIPRQQILCGFDYAGKVPYLEGPKFVYIHLLTPHHPFVFTENGGYVSKVNQNGILEDPNDNKTSINKKSYVDQLIFVNKKMGDLIDKILSESKNPPIIIIQSDHGPDIYMTDSFKNGKTMPQDDFIKARFRILNALYLPNGGNKIIPRNLTSVNSFRYIFNYYFKTDYEILENKNYYSPDYHLFEFTDVTRKVRF